MTTFFVVFIETYIFVCLVAFQQLNIVHKRFRSAFVTSATISAFHYHVIGQITHDNAPIGSPVWFAYLLGGPCGAVTTMYFFHKRKQ